VTELELGAVIGECMPRHRAKEFLRFLKKIDKLVAKHLNVHVVCDNYWTHKTKQVEAWLNRHKRFNLHFTPTSVSSRASPSWRRPSKPMPMPLVQVDGTSGRGGCCRSVNAWSAADAPRAAR